MDAIEEKRVFAGGNGPVRAYLASADGVLEVRLSGGRVGGFSLVNSQPATDVDVAGGELVVATDDDVLVGPPEGLEEVGVGPVQTVGRHSGRIAATTGDELFVSDGTGWDQCSTEGDLLAVDPPFAAGPAGVFRIHDGELESVGLEAVRDIVAGPQPVAATAAGVYVLANGWERRLETPVERVDTGQSIVALTADDTVVGPDREAETVPGPTVDVASSGGVIVAGPGGTVWTREMGEWRGHETGVRDVAAIAVERKPV